MITIICNLFIKEESIEDFKKITTYNHDNAIKEPGCLRFDMMVANDDPTQFTLYEVYKAASDIDFHKSTAHYAKWKEAVADMMAKPRVSALYTPMVPADEESYQTKN